jgi:ankyrin repeat protein
MHTNNGQGDSCPCKSSTLLYNIWSAAGFGRLDRVQHLIDDHNSDVNKCDEYGHSALHFAAQHGRLEVVKYLIKSGAAVNGDSCGCTALHRAAYSGHYETCLALLVAGADVEKRDSSTGDGRSALHKAALVGNKAIYDLLVKYGADETAADNKGITPPQLLHDVRYASAEVNDTNTCASDGRQSATAQLDRDTNDTLTRSLAPLHCFECDVAVPLLKSIDGQLFCLDCAAKYRR